MLDYNIQSGEEMLTRNLNDRSMRATNRHAAMQTSWDKTAKAMLKKRFKNLSARDCTKTSIMSSGGSSILNTPNQTSLMHQQSVFGYNEDGTRRVNPFG